MWHVVLRCCGGVNTLLDGGPGLQNAVHLCRFPGDVKQMLLSHQTGLVLYVRTGELQKEDVVRILYGASLPAIPRK
jgi:hypothetical protein